uniref:Uncharacterized protein n=1 Tax=Hucho hucho TaxID=62062 RepID=A0A4W5KEJ8_9TELE
STSPTELPDILKQFTKAAIRTQPRVVVATVERLERPVATQKTDTGLTPGLLKVLNKQILSNPQNDTRPPLSYLEMQQKWKGLCQPLEQLDTAGPGELLRQHRLDAIINALRYACEILMENEGGGAAMPFDLFRYCSYNHRYDSKQQEMVLKQCINVYTTKQNYMIQVANFYSGKH